MLLIYSFFQFSFVLLSIAIKDLKMMKKLPLQLAASLFTSPFFVDSNNSHICFCSSMHRFRFNLYRFFLLFYCSFWDRSTITGYDYNCYESKRYFFLNCLQSQSCCESYIISVSWCFEWQKKMVVHKMYKKSLSYFVNQFFWTKLRQKSKW